MSHPNKEHLVRFGRSDDSAIKTIFMGTRKEALKLANALAFVFWYEHSFKCSECNQETTRFEQDGFWVELKHQPVNYLFQGD